MENHFHCNQKQKSKQQTYLFVPTDEVVGDFLKNVKTFALISWLMRQ